MAKKPQNVPASPAMAAEMQFHALAGIHANNTGHLHAHMHNHAAIQSGAMAAAPHLIHNAFNPQHLNPQHLNPQQKKPRRS